MANDDKYEYDYVEEEYDDDEDEEYEDGERSWLRRFTYGFLWALGFYIFTNGLIGFTIGFTTAFNTGSPLAGELASENFFSQVGSIILVVQVLIFTVLCYYGLLPGVSKYERRDEVTHPPPPEAYGFNPEPQKSGEDTNED